MSLQNIQTEFVEALFSTTEMATIQPKKNFSIYQNNTLSHLIHALKNTYTLIMKLLGEDFFDVTAEVYIKQYPSRSGNLNDYGEYFSDFLSNYPPVENFIYLADVAKLEWACQCVSFAAEHPPFDKTLLQNISIDRYDQWRFVLHPASQLLQSRYPLFHIMDLCHGFSNETIDLHEGGVNLLIIRRELDISLVKLTSSEYIFLTVLQEEKSVAEALGAAVYADSNFKLNEKLPAWIEDKTLVDLHFV